MLRRRDELISDAMALMDDIKMLKLQLIDRRALDYDETRRRLERLYQYAERIYENLRLNN